jgi:DNA-binding NtrC family response regulator
MQLADARSIVVVDDDSFVRRLLRGWFEAEGHRVVELARGRDAIELLCPSAEDAPTAGGRADRPELERGSLDDIGLVCLDLGLDDMSGLDVLRHLRARGLDVPVLVVTAESDLAVAVEAMRRGAYDYVVKPLDRERLVKLSAHALEQRELSTRVRRLQRMLDAGAREPSERALVGDSAPMQAVQLQIERVRDSDVTVCIRGESGTGKELVARAIHDTSRRKGGPLVAINCAAIPASLQDSELFGHEKGAFTGATGQHRGRFEQAHRGTLFLDEVGEMGASTQAALLRTLQERTVRRVGGTTEMSVDVRVVCATHRDLVAEVKAGRFREDLYFRLVVYPIEVPPLRARLGDLPALVAHFLRRFRGDVGRPIERVSADALDALSRHAWPGNVRELQNVVHRAMLACDGEELELSHLPSDIRKTVLPPLPSQSAPRGAGGGASFGDDDEVLPLRELERRAIARAMAKSKGSVEKAAAMLGISRATLYRRIHEGSGKEGS